MEGLEARLEDFEEIPVGREQFIVVNALGSRLGRDISVTEQLNTAAVVEEAVNRLKVGVPSSCVGLYQLGSISKYPEFSKIVRQNCLDR